jgi:hypothetical protein
MFTIIRTSLVVAALASSILFSTPAGAGMVETRKATGEQEREAAVELLKGRMRLAGVAPEQFGDSLAQLSTSEAREAGALFENQLHAGSAAAAALVIIGVIVLIAILASKGKHGTENGTCEVDNVNHAIQDVDNTIRNTTNLIDGANELHRSMKEFEGLRHLPNILKHR